MIRTEDATLLESGGSAIVGTVDPAGLPDASRAWGIEVRGDQVRFQLSAAATRSIENLRAGGPVALTVTQVDTLRSVQVKGRATSVELATAGDVEAALAYAETFFANVHATDGSPVEALRNLVPRAFVVVGCTVDAVFDQTPGPHAGLRRERG